MAEQLTLVARRVNKAVKAPLDQPEPVHKVRVATRRARAALELFAPLLPPKKADWFLKRLRKLRKAADEARNLDVFSQRMQAQGVQLPDVVAKLVSKRRERAQTPLIKQHERLSAGKRWQKKQRALVAEIGKPKAAMELAKQPLKQFAPRALEPLTREFLAALAMKERSAAQLHQLRIAGKKLRYAIELLAPGLPKRLSKSTLSHLEKMQATLGDLNDLATAADLVGALAKDAKKRAARQWLKAQRKRERASFSEARLKFLRSWTPPQRQKWQKSFKRVLQET